MTQPEPGTNFSVALLREAMFTLVPTLCVGTSIFFDAPRPCPGDSAPELIQRLDPDITILNGIAMVLQQDRSVVARLQIDSAGRG